MKRLVCFIVGLSLLAGGGAWGADASKPRGVETQERPFGGPPNRAPRDMSDKCVVGNTTCTLDTKRKVGSECTCNPTNRSPAQGRVVR